MFLERTRNICLSVSNFYESIKPLKFPLTQSEFYLIFYFALGEEIQAFLKDMI